MERIFVAIDVETTGLRAGVDEIIEVAAVKFRGGEVLEQLATLVRPRQSVPLKITRLTGIEASSLSSAPTFHQIAPQLVSFIKTYPLIGHSVNFDLGMLRAQGMSFGQQAYDTFELATLLLPRLPAYRLAALADYFGISNPGAHRALHDADVCRQVFLRLIERIAELDLDHLGQINRLTSKLNWPLRDLFVEAEKAHARRIFDQPLHASEPTPRPESNWQDLAPLRPTGATTPLNQAEVRNFFSPQGPMGRAFPGYEQREAQVQMAASVAESFNDSEALLVEAGTGTGKGLAYLVPAALYAAQRGERVVVSTNTINLQDQLFFKDIPALQRLLATPGSVEPAFTAALLKGRGNYLCLRRYKQLLREEHLDQDEARTLLKVQFWLPTTSSGDKAELPLLDKEQLTWSQINVTPETCIGPKCPEFRECFFFQARRQAESAHIVVVNHALLLADLVSQSMVLPAYDHVIIDEAHNLEDVATDQFSFAADQEAMLRFLDDLYNVGGARIVGGLLSELPNLFRAGDASQADQQQALRIADELRPLIERARTAVYDCFVRLMNFMKFEAGASSTYDPRLRLTPAIRQRPAWAEIVQAWENLSLQLSGLSNGLGKLEALLSELEGADLLDYDQMLLRVQSLRRFASDTRVNIGHLVLGDDDGLISWLTYDQRRQTLTLQNAPLSVAELLHASLFSQKATAVLASATLAIDGSFEYVRNRIGLDQANELQLDSPFDYERQALVFIPNDIPEPNQRGYQQALEQALIHLCGATGGRALVLFTATNALRQTYEAIQEPLEEQEITVLAQGIDGSRRSLLDRLREAPRTVLLGTTSFWEGVDVVGDALSVLVIAKLPFSVPTDPIYAARSEQFQDAFAEYSVPQAILRFKQGFGRLVRSREDRGVVVVLDRRLLSKAYGQTFLHSLPQTRVRTGQLKDLPTLATRFLG